jgi:hypothetical protein
MSHAELHMLLHVQRTGALKALNQALAKGLEATAVGGAVVVQPEFAGQPEVRSVCHLRQILNSQANPEFVCPYKHVCCTSS